MMGEQRWAPHRTLAKGKDGIFYYHWSHIHPSFRPSSQGWPSLCFQLFPTPLPQSTLLRQHLTEATEWRQMLFITPSSATEVPLDAHEPLSLVPHGQHALIKS